jgi:hypothetical protein
MQTISRVVRIEILERSSLLVGTALSAPAKMNVMSQVIVYIFMNFSGQTSEDQLLVVYLSSSILRRAQKLKWIIFQIYYNLSLLERRMALSTIKHTL